ncbi:MAG: hypothetical protein GY793_11865 [Proteobacteria bacterium]|nr:hypothetical protein [Pseudomonadota bacterium]
MNLPNLHSYYAYKHPTLKDQYLIYRYELIGSRVDYELYLYDTNTCQKTKSFDIGSMPYFYSFSYAMYNENLYGIFITQSSDWDEKRKDWHVWRESAPEIINLSKHGNLLYCHY